jgi:hypothetical protein
MTKLKLVAPKADSVQRVSTFSQSHPSTTSFTVKAHKIGSRLYEMTIQDSFHELACDLVMEIEGNGEETAVVCHFPSFMDDSHKLLDEDEDLYGIIMIQFQMKVLDHLFLFCTEHKASQLSIYMDDDQAEGFCIVQAFLTHCDESIMEYHEKTEMLISTDQNILGEWRTFMKKTNLELEQDLWRQQRHNLVIRNYLRCRNYS